jgi:hypothetical protein
MRADLVSGAFRVHRAGCRDCQREARRSDSPGDAEEYASQADVIACLWSDIIAENLTGTRAISAYSAESRQTRKWARRVRFRPWDSLSI